MLWFLGYASYSTLYGFTEYGFFMVIIYLIVTPCDYLEEKDTINLMFVHFAYFQVEATSVDDSGYFCD